MANTPEEFPVFSKLSEQQIAVLRAKFTLYLKDFEIKCGITDIYTSNPVMIEIYERIEKRRT